MKRSQIALLSVGGVLAVAVIASVVSARIAPYRGASEPVDEQAIAGGAGLRGFHGVEVAGKWHVRLNRGDDWRVDLSYPEVLEDRVKAHVIGDRLRLEIESDSSWSEAALPVSADIVMPALEDVDARGGTLIEVSGFQGRRLEIDIAGAARLTGRDGRYDELELSVAGAGDIDLRGIAVTDADVDLAGASKVTLTMDGGTLSGSMAGAGRIEYHGTVARESVRVAGAARVERAR